MLLVGEMVAPWWLGEWWAFRVGEQARLLEREVVPLDLREHRCGYQTGRGQIRRDMLRVGSEFKCLIFTPSNASAMLVRLCDRNAD